MFLSCDMPHKAGPPHPTLVSPYNTSVRFGLSATTVGNGEEGVFYCGVAVH